MSAIDKGIERFFWDADRDRSGSLSLVELRAALARNGYVMTDTQFQEKFADFDLDGDGLIYFHEYLRGMGRSEKDVFKYQQIARVFRLFDTTNKGYIRRDDINAMFTRQGRGSLNRRQLDNIMIKVDADKSNRIEMDEFIALYDKME